MTNLEFISKVIRVRRAIMHKDASPKSKVVCKEIIKRLERQVAAYNLKWSLDQWKAFLKRNHEDITFLIPANVQGKKLITQLNGLIV